MERKSLRIGFWKDNGIANKITELTAYVEEEKADVMLIGETHLKPPRKFNIRNYYTYRNDRHTKQGGGTAVLVKRSILH